jgi:hypothetical protein
VGNDIDASEFSLPIPFFPSSTQHQDEIADSSNDPKTLYYPHEFSFSETFIYMSELCEFFSDLDRAISLLSGNY